MRLISDQNVSDLKGVTDACYRLDGKLDALERKKIGKEAREAIRALEAVLRGLELDGDE